MSKDLNAKDLNEFVKDGKIIKINGKSVFYFDKEQTCKLFNIPITSISDPVTSLEYLLNLHGIRITMQAHLNI